MKQVVVEIRGQKAVVLSDGGRFETVKNRNYAIGQVIEMKERKAKQTGRLFPMAAAVAAVLCIGGGGVWAWASPYAYVSLDVNPSVEYTLNRFDRVLSVKAVNDDGESLLERQELKNLSGKAIDDAIALTVAKIGDQGFFDGDLPGGVVITTSGRDLKKAGVLAEELKERVEEETGDKEVQVESLSVGLERVQEARELGVTPGKLNLVEKLAAGAGGELDQEEWLQKPVREIMKAIQENKAEDKAAAKEEKAQDKAESKADKAESQAQSKEEKAQDKAESKADKAESQAQSKGEKTQDKAQSKADKAESQAQSKEEKAQDKAQSKADKGAEKAEDKAGKPSGGPKEKS